MRKEFLLKTLVLALGLVVVAVSVVSVRSEVAAHDGEDHGVVVEEMMGEEQEEMMEEMMEDMGEREEEVSYYLPYPGILPDHPFYFVKMFRDRMVEWLTRNDLKKVELLELYADKRLGAAKVLVEGGKPSLGSETAVKASVYQERAVERLSDMKDAGVNVGDLANRLERATAKHVSVLKEVIEKTSDSAREGLEKALERSQKGNDRLQGILGRE